MKILNFKEIESTNLYIKNNHDILDDMTFVCADYQTLGKGRNERTWLSNANENLLFSFLIKDSELLKHTQSISLSIAYLVAEFLEEFGLKNIEIKWPNDIYANDKKICGILLEGCVPNFVVVGVGLNVNQTSFISNLRKEPTSIKLELKNTHNIEKLKSVLLEKIYGFYRGFFEQKTEYLQFCRTHNYFLNKSVIVNDVYGKVIDINEKNELIILDKQNKLHCINSGEVSLYINDVKK